MAFQFNNVAKIEEGVKPEMETPSTIEIASIFTKEELEVLLLSIRDMTFKGSEVEKVFTLTLKLQQMYLNS